MNNLNGDDDEITEKARFILGGKMTSMPLEVELSNLLNEIKKNKRQRKSKKAKKSKSKKKAKRNTQKK